MANPGRVKDVALFKSQNNLFFDCEFPLLLQCMWTKWLYVQAAFTADYPSWVFRIYCPRSISLYRRYLDLFRNCMVLVFGVWHRHRNMVVEAFLCLGCGIGTEIWLSRRPLAYGNTASIEGTTTLTTKPNPLLQCRRFNDQGRT
jgi:hypothetical protein